jgi:hypothetical protein
MSLHADLPVLENRILFIEDKLHNPHTLWICFH